MEDYNIYDTIARRYGGDIYIGVVGPVRTGKSTFIRKFIDAVVIPNIEGELDRARTTDEIPQSGSGKTITTTEPKFTPAEAVSITLGDTRLNAKVIDCVGYMVEGALGALEDGEERMVMTPWSEEAIPFSEASEIGTKKVVKEHSTIAVLVTTDGSICEIPREKYVAAEERVVSELKEYGKPFAIVLNSKNPESEEAQALAQSLEEKYSAPVALVDCTRIDEKDAGEILGLVVGEFPIKELTFKLPSWISALDGEHPLISDITEKIRSFASQSKKLSDLNNGHLEWGFEKKYIDAGRGEGGFEFPISREKYFEILSQLTGVSLTSEKELFTTFVELSRSKDEYDKVKDALADAKEKGYGIVMPSREELVLSEPTLIKQGAGYGVKVSASAESIHMVRCDIKADVCPALGSEEQSEEVIKTMTRDYEESPEKLLDSKIFGRSLYDLVNDGMNAKLTNMPDESREKLGHTLEKIINEGAGGLVCILL